MRRMHFELKWLPVVVLVAGAGLAGARQQWEEEPGYREVNPGGEVVMVCRVRDKRGECRWERDNTPIAAYPGKYEWAGRAEEGDCSLRILAAKHEYDNGAWVCQVTASSFRERDTLISHPANLVVRAPPTSVHLRLPGESSPFSGSLVATSGTEVEVECAAEAGNPPPGLRWWLGGERWEAGVTTSEDLEDGTTVSRVRIPVSQADHGKAVRCEVVHEALTRSLEAEASLDIQYLPRVQLQPAALADITEGDRVLVSCAATGNPAPSLAWRRADTGEVVARTADLELPAVRRDQAGRYSCRADNAVGQSEAATVEISVQYAPVISSVSPAHNVTQQLRSRLELRCAAAGNPAPRYSWVHHSEAGSEVRGHEAVLVIAGLGYGDQGHYECRASNTIRGRQHAVKSSLVYVNVTGAPRVAEERSEVFIVQGSTAEVSVEFCADPLPKLNWHLGGPSEGHSLLLCSECTHQRFSVLKEAAAEREDCYISTLVIAAADQTDSRDYQLHLENPHGVELHTVRVTVGELLSNETLVGAVVGGVFVLILLLIALFYCARRCCPSKQLKQDIESASSGSSGHSWGSTSSGSDTVSLATEPSSELSHAHLAPPTVHHALSVSQECLKPGLGLSTSPTPSNLTDASSGQGSRVSYNDLCFPKTANYGSMRKSGRCDLEARLACARGVEPPPPPPAFVVLPPPSGSQQNSIYHFH